MFGYLSSTNLCRYRTCIFWPYVVQLSAACILYLHQFSLSFHRTPRTMKVWTWTSKIIAIFNPFFHQICKNIEIMHHIRAQFYLFSISRFHKGEIWSLFVRNCYNILLIFTWKLDFRFQTSLIPQFFIMIFCIIGKLKMLYTYLHTLTIKICR